MSVIQRSSITLVAALTLLGAAALVPVASAAPAQSAVGASAQAGVAAPAAGTSPARTARHKRSVAAHAIDVAQSEVVNLNTATAAELDRLPGVGPSKAERIVAHRTKNGRFKQVDDLRRVKGFGFKTVKRLRPLLVVDGPTTLSDKPAPRAAAPSVGGNASARAFLGLPPADDTP